MMDEVKGLSAGLRFALTRQLAARCVVLMAYVLAGYCVPWLWGLILALVSGGHQHDATRGSCLVSANRSPADKPFTSSIMTHTPCPCR